MSKKATKLIAMIALIWIIISVVWSWVLVIYEMYFKDTWNIVEWDYSDLLNKENINNENLLQEELNDNIVENFEEINIVEEDNILEN